MCWVCYPRTCDSCRRRSLTSQWIAMLTVMSDFGYNYFYWSTSLPLLRSPPFNFANAAVGIRCCLRVRACVRALKRRDIKVRASPVDEMLHKAVEVSMRLIFVVVVWKSGRCWDSSGDTRTSMVLITLTLYVCVWVCAPLISVDSLLIDG